MDKIKVLQVNIDDLNYGGVFALIKSIISRKSERIEYSIATIEGFRKKENRDYFEEKGINIHDIGGESNKILKQRVIYKQLYYLLSNECFECVHIHADTANKLLVSAMAAKRAKVHKVIIHSHASGVEGRGRSIKLIVHYFCRFFIPFVADVFVACSDNAKDWMYPHGINATIINNGIDLEKFRFDASIRNIERAKLGIDKEIVVGHVGRFSYPKNHEFIIDIVNALAKRGIAFKCVLVGAGELEEAIKRKVDNYGLNNYVIFYGTTNDIPRVLQMMDVFILPSFYEGYPIVGVEAQANGLPIVLSNTLSNTTKITENACFEKIGIENVEAWCDKIIDLSSRERKDTYSDLKNKHMDITDTIKQFEKLYL